MKKTLAALAAISLLLIISTLKQEKADEPLTLAVHEKAGKPAHQTAAATNTPENEKLAVKPEPAVAGFTSELLLNLALRYRFDDIIHQHRMLEKSLEPLLLTLADRLKLTHKAGEHLQALFYRYRHYLNAMSDLKENIPAVDTVIDIAESQRFLQQVYGLQSQYFSEAEILAFFGQEKTYNQQTLERVAIRQDPSLDKAQRQMLINYQISQLDPQALAPLQPTISAKKITALLTDDKAQDLTLSPELVETINATREKNRLWQQKVRDYQEKITASQHLDKDSYRQQRESYQLAHFSENERKRLRVFLKHPQLLATSLP